MAASNYCPYCGNKLIHLQVRIGMATHHKMGCPVHCDLTWIIHCTEDERFSLPPGQSIANMITKEPT